MTDKQHQHHDRQHQTSSGRSNQGQSSQNTTDQGRRLTAADCRRYFDDYLRYRFGNVGSLDDFAKEAGISTQTANDLFSENHPPDADLDKVAAGINVSRALLDEILGYQPMPELMRQTLDRFFEMQQKQGNANQGHGHEHKSPEHKSKGAHAA